MRADGVVVSPPCLDQDLGFGEAEEQLAIEQLVAQLAVEALAIAVFPRTSRFDIGGFGAYGGDPIAERAGNELRPIVGSDIGWWSVQDHQISQGLQHVGGVQFALHPDGQCLVGELVDHAQHSELPSIVGPILDEVIGPDVVRPIGAQAHARAVVQPEPAALWLFLWDFQPLPSPDPLHPLGVHCPAGMAQQGRDPPVAVAAVGHGQLDDVGGQRRFVIAPPGGLALGGPMLAQGRASPPFGDPQFRSDPIHAGPATGGA